MSSPKIASLVPFTGQIPAPSGVTALDPKDSEEPRTQSYSFTIAQRLPWKSQMEVAYVGSKSDYLSNWNNNFDQINDIGIGTMFTAQGWLANCYPSGNPPNDGGACSKTGADTGYSTGAVNDARPLHSGPCVAANNCLGTLKIIDHKMYSNYNSLQVTWNKQSGPLTFLTNYTFGKALGIRGEGGAAAGDPTVLANNYGTLPNNRTHIFNIAYVYEFPKVANASRFVKQLANGWQVSGIGHGQNNHGRHSGHRLKRAWHFGSHPDACADLRSAKRPQVAPVHQRCLLLAVRYARPAGFLHFPGIDGPRVL